MTRNPHLSDPKVFANWKAASARHPTHGLNRAVNCVDGLAVPETWYARVKFRKKKGPRKVGRLRGQFGWCCETCLNGHVPYSTIEKKFGYFCSAPDTGTRFACAW